MNEINERERNALAEVVNQRGYLVISSTTPIKVGTQVHLTHVNANRFLTQPQHVFAEATQEDYDEQYRALCRILGVNPEHHAIGCDDYLYRASLD